jgi:hypothetical protein
LDRREGEELKTIDFPTILSVEIDQSMAQAPRPAAVAGVEEPAVPKEVEETPIEQFEDTNQFISLDEPEKQPQDQQANVQVAEVAVEKNVNVAEEPSTPPTTPTLKEQEAAENLDKKSLNEALVKEEAKQAVEEKKEEEEEAAKKPAGKKDKRKDKKKDKKNGKKSDSVESEEAKPEPVEVAAVEETQKEEQPQKEEEEQVKVLPDAVETRVTLVETNTRTNDACETVTETVTFEMKVEAHAAVFEELKQQLGVEDKEKPAAEAEKPNDEENAAEKEQPAAVYITSSDIIKLPEPRVPTQEEVEVNKYFLF